VASSQPPRRPLAPTPVPAAPVTAQTASRGVIQQTLSYSGDIRAREQVSVLPKNSGRVERMLVDVGSKVKAGDTIATLEQESAQISALQARATLAGAEAKLASLQNGPRPMTLPAPRQPSSSSRCTCRACNLAVGTKTSNSPRRPSRRSKLGLI